MRVKNEPVISMVLGLVAAAVALLIAFGVHITEVQAGAISGFVAAALAVGFYVRSRVSPTAREERSSWGSEKGEAVPWLLAALWWLATGIALLAGGLFALGLGALGFAVLCVGALVVSEVRQHRRQVRAVAEFSERESIGW